MDEPKVHPCDARDAQADGWMISKRSSILAYRAQDDGSKHGAGFHLNTLSFTLDENQLLCKVPLEKFGLKNLYS